MHASFILVTKCLLKFHMKSETTQIFIALLSFLIILIFSDRIIFKTLCSTCYHWPVSLLLRCLTEQMSWLFLIMNYETYWKVIKGGAGNVPRSAVPFQGVLGILLGTLASMAVICLTFTGNHQSLSWWPTSLWKSNSTCKPECSWVSVSTVWLRSGVAKKLSWMEKV